MSKINSPDIDPANNYSLVGSINNAFQKMMQAMNGMLPAQVTSYDREKNRVEVQLSINLLTTDGSQIPRPHLVNIPVLTLGGGLFSMSFPLKSGDLGWVLANDRDISSFLQSYSQGSPNTTRMNNFADGMFIPDLMKSYNISAPNEKYLVIQSNDGTMSIQMGINTSNNAHEINVTCDRLNITTNSGAGYVNVNGNLFVSGLIENPTGAVLPLPVVPPFPP
jgi:hypothetical protein